ncbi:MAG TPA: hypothetical protein VMV92_21620 [Streptosporangiaceae bacterium]|nr:hypothetical protein [Streptosporangiaceae bacterium]
MVGGDGVGIQAHVRADLSAARRPTAVFCANDLLALGVLQEMTARRLGRTAVQLLLDETISEGGHQHRQMVFKPELVVREPGLAPPRHQVRRRVRRRVGRWGRRWAAPGPGTAEAAG